MHITNSPHRLFILVILLKWVEWVLQLIIGFLAFILSPKILHEFFWTYFQTELVEDQHDIIAGFLLHSLQWLTLSTQYFIGFYFISHGIIKFFIVYNILKRRAWAYPFALIIFSSFTLYQVYLFAISWSLWMIGLIIIDIIVAILTYIEWTSLKKRHFRERGASGVPRNHDSLSKSKSYSSDTAS